MPGGKGRGRTVVGGRAVAEYEVRGTKYEVLKLGATELRGIWQQSWGGWCVVGHAGGCGERGRREKEEREGGAGREGGGGRTVVGGRAVARYEVSGFGATELRGVVGRKAGTMCGN